MRSLLRLPGLSCSSRVLGRELRSTSAVFDEKEVYTNPNVNARKGGAAGPGKAQTGGQGQQGLFKRLRSEAKGDKRPNQGSGDRLRTRKPGSSPQRGSGGAVRGGMNAKVGGANNRGRSGAGPRLGGGAGGDGGGRDGKQKKWIKGAGKGGKGRRDKDHSRGDYSGDGIPPAIQALLYDHEFFKAQALKGKGINTRDMDGIDTFFAQSFMESNKTVMSEHRAVVESDSLRRTHVPNPRSIDELFHDTYGMIGEINGGLNERMGGDFAANLNETLQRNVCYSNEDKRYMMGIASSLGLKYLNRAELIAAEAAKSAEENPENMYGGYDMIFSSKFRKGLAGIEAEKAHKASIVSRGHVVDYTQEDTNWDADAVVDEDEL